MATRTRGVSPPPHGKASSAFEAKEFRAQHGISLEAVAEQTKISIRFLRAIESEDFTQLPGGIFATSYLRQYAAAIGVDSEPLVQRYEERLRALTPKAPESSPRAGFFERLFRVPA
jgi:cytoskeletal protein RodZ